MRQPKLSIRDFWDRVQIDNPSNLDSCWSYTGPKTETQYQVYGTFGGELAHKIAVAIYIGKPVGTVKRRCGNPLCVRREHMVSVSPERIKKLFDPYTGERLPQGMTTDSKAFKEMLKRRKDGLAVLVKEVSEKHKIEVKEIKKNRRKLTLHAIIQERELLVKAKKPIPMKPNL